MARKKEEKPKVKRYIEEVSPFAGSLREIEEFEEKNFYSSNSKQIYHEDIIKYVWLKYGITTLDKKESKKHPGKLYKSTVDYDKNQEEQIAKERYYSQFELDNFIKHELTVAIREYYHTVSTQQMCIDTDLMLPLSFITDERLRSYKYIRTSIEKETKNAMKGLKDIINFGYVGFNYPGTITFHGCSGEADVSSAGYPVIAVPHPCYNLKRGSGFGTKVDYYEVRNINDMNFESISIKGKRSDGTEVNITPEDFDTHIMDCTILTYVYSEIYEENIVFNDEFTGGTYINRDGVPFERIVDESFKRPKK